MKKPTTYIEVDLKALLHNLRQIRRLLRPRTKILLVVKAEAYGHGMVKVAKAARRLRDIVYLGVSNATEALVLRQNKIKTPILVLSSVHPGEIKELIRHNVTTTVSSLEEAQAVNNAARRLNKKANVHVELDTGMGRLGVATAEALSLLFKVNNLPHLDLEGAYSHFPSADERVSDFSHRQITVFEMAVDCFRELYPKRLQWAHMANSTGLLAYEDAHFNLVRPGIMAYGICPTKGKCPVPLKPVLSFKTHVAFNKSIEKGASVSYGRTYTAKKKTRIATLPVGYSSGYPFRLSGRSRVLIRGRSFPIAGRVTMDHLMVDVGNGFPVRRWDEATLIGRSGSQSVRAEELARHANTIPYEIVCSLNSQIPRVYKR